MIVARYSVLLAFLTACATAQAQSDDVSAGEKLYTSQCRMCHGFNDGKQALPAGHTPGQVRFAHAVGAGAPARTDVQQFAFAPPFGPNLHGIVGREAGTVPDFQYSREFLAALKGTVWSEDTLDRWIRDTQAWVPGVMMYYRQPDPEVRRKIIAFLKAKS